MHLADDALALRAMDVQVILVERHDGLALQKLKLAAAIGTNGSV
jgi:hypothetical protein